MSLVTKAFYALRDNSHLLRNRVNEGARGSRADGKRNTREPTTSTYIDKLIFCTDIRQKEQRVDEVKDDSLFDIGNGSDVDILVPLKDIEKVVYELFCLIL